MASLSSHLIFNIFLLSSHLYFFALLIIIPLYFMKYEHERIEVNEMQKKPPKELS